MDNSTCPRCGARKQVRLHAPEPGRMHRRLYCPCQWRQPTARWKAKNPEKRHAHRVVNHAIKMGRLVPQPCEVCGAEVVEAHHDDYSAPLDVRWLCREHHMALHREERAKNRAEGENVVTPPLPSLDSPEA